MPKAVNLDDTSNLSDEEAGAVLDALWYAYTTADDPADGFKEGYQQRIAGKGGRAALTEIIAMAKEVHPGLKVEFNDGGGVAITQA